MSSVRIASLKPPLSSPSWAPRGTTQSSKRRVASGCGAITSMCSEVSRPGVVASTMNTVMPRVPPAGSVLANTQ